MVEVEEAPHPQPVSGDEIGGSSSIIISSAGDGGDAGDGDTGGDGGGD